VSAGQVKRTKLPVIQPRIKASKGPWIIQLGRKNRSNPKAGDISKAFLSQSVECLEKRQIRICVSLVKPLFSNWPTTVPQNPRQMAVQDKNDPTGGDYCDIG
jgi:hypothetical protein